MTWLLVAIAFIGGLAAARHGLKRQRLRREEFINRYEFPPGLFERLARRRPGLSGQDRQRTDAALRQYFRIYLKSGFKFVSMPSQLADDLWHEFILYTRNYHI